MSRIYYSKYVKPELTVSWSKYVEHNTGDKTGDYIILTSLTMMINLMRHTFDGVHRGTKLTPKQAWNLTINSIPKTTPGVKALAAIDVAYYSMRGVEFRQWCIDNDIVKVDWK